MLENNLIKATKKYIQHTLHHDSSHDWWHVYRVWKLAAYIANREKANSFLVEMAALLHDLEDWKFVSTPQNQGTIQWLRYNDVPEEIQSAILDIINNISFKGAHVPLPPLTLEGKIVQDADRLDAIGAIGIARTFAYGGYQAREIYNPNVAVILHSDPVKYKSHKGTTINHFYEKLLLLKDKMHTTTAKEIAETRHEYMLSFLQNFFQEWEVDVTLLENNK